MPKICYREYRHTRATQVVIDQVNEIVVEYQAMGLTMTLRQLYYQLVARDLIPNTDQSYARIKNIVSQGRLGGLVDWSAIEDRTRELKSNAHWDSPGAIIQAVAAQYEIDKWVGQTYRPEVWVEKEALLGVIEDPCGDLDVSFCACKGYSSQSMMWRAGRRLVEHIDGRDQIPVILHFGDHDPSGIHMTTDIETRLRMFVEHHTEDREIIVERIALTQGQVDEYSPPPNVAKQTDARYAAYRAEHGNECWELDALSPPVLVRLVRDAVLRYCDQTEWDAREALEAEEQGQLQDVSLRWDAVTSYVAERVEDEQSGRAAEYDDDDDDEE